MSSPHRWICVRQCSHSEIIPYGNKRLLCNNAKYSGKAQTLQVRLKCGCQRGSEVKHSRWRKSFRNYTGDVPTPNCSGTTVQMYEFFWFFSVERLAEICQAFHDQSPQARRDDQARKLRSQSIQIAPSDDLDGRKVQGISSPHNESQNVSMIDFATPAADVSAFCRAVLCNLIPNGFWGVGNGADANQKVIMHHVDRFIHLRRFENLSLHLVSQKLQVGGSSPCLKRPS